MNSLGPDGAAGVSVVVPVHNEEAIVQQQVRLMVEALSAAGGEYELFLCENGSTDGTADAAHRLAAENNRITVLHLPQPDYGLAFRRGLESARYEKLICVEIDHWSGTFFYSAAHLLKECDVVVASKRVRGAEDLRPWKRKFASALFHELVRWLFGYPGTDTHGMTAYRRRSISPVLATCTTAGDTLTTELLIRAYFSGLTIAEVPCQTVERRPARVPLCKRLLGTMRNLACLLPAARDLRRQVHPACRGKVIRPTDAPRV
jgi:hypothetical protein